jgi:hypothetical protein
VANGPPAYRFWLPMLTRCLILCRLGNERAKGLAETLRTVTESEKKAPENTVQEVTDNNGNRKRKQGNQKESKPLVLLSRHGLFRRNGDHRLRTLFLPENLGAVLLVNLRPGNGVLPCYGEGCKGKRNSPIRLHRRCYTGMYRLFQPFEHG